MHANKHKEREGLRHCKHVDGFDLGPVRELLINVKARELMAIAGGVLKQRREECVGEPPTSPLWSRLDTHGRLRHHPRRRRGEDPRHLRCVRGEIV
jgi:hypothetical protein